MAVLGIFRRARIERENGNGGGQAKDQSGYEFHKTDCDSVDDGGPCWERIFSGIPGVPLDRPDRVPAFLLLHDGGDADTHDIKKYALRLGAFALISQPFWILAFHADDIAGNLLNLNIFFTLLVSLLSVWGFKEKKWWLFAAGLILLNVINFDYAMTGLILMLIFYLCRNKPWLGAVIYAISYLPALWGGSLEDPLALKIGDWAIGFEIFALLALPFIYAHTRLNPRVSKWFFYIYYPAHLLVIFLIKMIL